MIDCAPVSKKSIQRHYDWATPFYRLLWGPHIHHGLWDSPVSANNAQVRLIERLASAAGLKPGSDVLDVGCGMGGSTIALARRYGCTVTGLTLSPVQRVWATIAAACSGVRPRVRFRRADAEHVQFPDQSFDVVWTIECSEHLFDKPGFMNRAAGWLRPGGRAAICAWLAGDKPGIESQVAAVGDGFLCPSFGTFADYTKWLEAAGLHVTVCDDLTAQVMRTWEICAARVRASGVGILARLAGRRMHNFVNRFTTLLDAYRSGAMQYGLIVAVKP